MSITIHADDPRARVRRLLRAGVCPACGRKPKAGRHLFCAACLEQYGYCSYCEAVAPLSEFHRPSAARRAAGSRHGHHKPCAGRWRTPATPEQREQANRRRVEKMIAAAAPVNRERGRRSRAAVVAVVRSLGAENVGRSGFWPRVAVALGKSPDAVRRAWNEAIKYGEVDHAA